MNKDIEITLDALKARTPAYQRTARYYNGEHDLQFATDKFRNTFGTLFRAFALNMCPAVCDAVGDKLLINGFAAGGDHEKYRHIPHRAESIWKRNRMSSRAARLHGEALMNGDAYAVIWPDTQGRAVIYPDKAAQIYVANDGASPHTEFAAKTWSDADGTFRLNLFYPDRVEQYKSKTKLPGGIATVNDLRPAEIPLVQNPLGVVPVFHFANNPSIDGAGRSELDQMIPIQDGLNKAAMDMLVAMEFSAYRQRWVAGIEIDYDEGGRPVAPFTAGVDHLWITQNPSATFGDFDTADLEQFLKVKDSFRTDIASVTGTPLHYLLQNATRDFPSGEALRAAEARFLAKVAARQECFGEVWADMMSLCLKIEIGSNDADLVTIWEDPAPRSEREYLENVLLKREIGISAEQAMAEIGYGLSQPQNT